MLEFCLKCILKISAIIFFLVGVLVYFLSLFPECSSCICLSFHVWNYPQGKQVISFHWHFCYHLVAWTLVFNHTVIIFYVDSLTFLCHLSNSQKIVFHTFDMIDIRNKLTLPLFGYNTNSTFSQKSVWGIISKCNISLK